MSNKPFAPPHGTSILSSPSLPRPTLGPRPVHHPNSFESFPPTHPPHQQPHAQQFAAERYALGPQFHHQTEIYPALSQPSNFRSDQLVPAPTFVHPTQYCCGCSSIPITTYPSNDFTHDTIEHPPHSQLPLTHHQHGAPGYCISPQLPPTHQPQYPQQLQQQFQQQLPPRHDRPHLPLPPRLSHIELPLPPTLHGSSRSTFTSPSSHSHPLAFHHDELNYCSTYAPSTAHYAPPTLIGEDVYHDLQLRSPISATGGLHPGYGEISQSTRRSDKDDCIELPHMLYPPIDANNQAISHENTSSIPNNNGNLGSTSSKPTSRATPISKLTTPATTTSITRRLTESKQKAQTLGASRPTTVKQSSLPLDTSIKPQHPKPTKFHTVSRLDQNPVSRPSCDAHYQSNPYYPQHHHHPRPHPVSHSSLPTTSYCHHCSCCQTIQQHHAAPYCCTTQISVPQHTLCTCGSSQSTNHLPRYSHHHYYPPSPPLIHHHHHQSSHLQPRSLDSTSIEQSWNQIVDLYTEQQRLIDEQLDKIEEARDNLKIGTSLYSSATRLNSSTIGSNGTKKT